MAGGTQKFGKPPLVEVYCEFVLEPANEEPWDGLRVFEFIQYLQADYPNREMLSFGGRQSQLHDEDQFNSYEVVDTDTSYPLFRFRSEDGNSIVQVGENLLVVNQLPPYYGWSNFLPHILRGLHAYLQVWRPKSVGQASLHYIDRVEIPETEFALRDYFNLFPTLPEGFNRPYTNLLLSMDLEGCGKGDILSVSIRQESAISPDSNAFLLNWDYGATAPIPLEDQLLGITEWLEVAHDCCWDLFSSIFTERCMALFEPRR